MNTSNNTINVWPKMPDFTAHLDKSKGSEKLKQDLSNPIRLVREYFGISKDEGKKVKNYVYRTDHEGVKIPLHITKDRFFTEVLSNNNGQKKTRTKKVEGINHYEIIDNYFENDLGVPIPGGFEDYQKRVYEQYEWKLPNSNVGVGEEDDNDKTITIEEKRELYKQVVGKQVPPRYMNDEQRMLNKIKEVQEG